MIALSEVGWPQAFFDRFFPILGSDFGLGALGIMQLLYVPICYEALKRLLIHYLDWAARFSPTSSTHSRSCPRSSVYRSDA